MRSTNHMGLTPDFRSLLTHSEKPQTSKILWSAGDSSKSKNGDKENGWREIGSENFADDKEDENQNEQGYFRITDASSSNSASSARWQDEKFRCANRKKESIVICSDHSTASTDYFSLLVPSRYVVYRLFIILQVHWAQDAALFKKRGTWDNRCCDESQSSKDYPGYQFGQQKIETITRLGLHQRKWNCQYLAFPCVLVYFLFYLIFIYFLLFFLKLIRWLGRISVFSIFLNFTWNSYNPVSTIRRLLYKADGGKWINSPEATSGKEKRFSPSRITAGS